MDSDARNRRSSRREIRQELNSLKEPIYIQDPSCNELNFYRQHGFCLLKDQLTIEPEVTEEMKEKFGASDLRFQVIQESNSPTRVNRLHAANKSFITKHLYGRNARYEFGEHGEYSLQQIHEAVTDHIPEFFWGTSRLHLETLETILYRRENSGGQSPRRGLREDYGERSIITLSVMSADSKLIIYPGSHLGSKEGRPRARPIRFGFEAGDIIFLHPRLIFSHDTSSESHLWVQHIIIAYRLEEEWDLVCDETENAIESLVEWSTEERKHNELDLARERQVGIGVEEAHGWLGQPVEGVNRGVVFIRGRDAWAMMVEAEEDGEWSD